MKNINLFKKSWALLGASVFALSVAPNAAFAQQGAPVNETEQRDYDIKAGSLSSALTELSRQSGRQVLYRSADIQGLSTKGVKGRYSLKQVADLLLNNTNLLARYDANGSMAVVAQNATAAWLPDETISPESEEPILVVGTRIEGADPTQRVESLDRDDFDRLGVTTVEDALRTVLQNFSSTNSFSETDNDARETNLPLGPVRDGISSINLRGLGSENTLVLVNGRRVSGVAGAPDNLTNIAGIPLSAIERIDILPDGASAAYGADAIGGVVNIVLRKDFESFDVSARYENSSTGADAFIASATAGKSWSNGSIIVTGNYRNSDRVRSSSAGFTSRFFPGVFDDADNPIVIDQGFSPDLDGRLFVSPTSEIRFVNPFFAGFNGIPNPTGAVVFALPAGNDGTNFTGADVVTFDSVVQAVDNVPEFLGTEQESFGFSVNFTQDLASNLVFNASLLGSFNETFREGQIARTIPIAVPDSNAFSPFNTFGIGVFAPRVLFFPDQELAAGLIQTPTTTTKQSQYAASGSLVWDISPKVRWSIGGDFSRSSNESRATGLTNLTDPIVVEALASGDPDVALNLFGDGSAQNATAVAALFGGVTGGDPISRTFTIDTTLNARLFDIGAGDIQLVLGGEFRREQIRNSNILSDGTAGVTASDREITSGFGELFIPFISSRNGYPGLRRLSVSLQARYDRYSSSTPFGVTGGDGTPGSESPIIQQVVFDNLTPRIGAAYSPFKGLDFRVSWGESFRAPTIGDITTLNVTLVTADFNDPFDPVNPGVLLQNIPTDISAANPDLRPESSTNFSAGLTFKPQFLPGFKFDANWSRVNFRDRIVNTFELNQFLTTAQLLSIPGVAVRDANGSLIRVDAIPLNLDARVVEIIDFSADYEFDVGEIGAFTIGGDATVYLDLFDRLNATDEDIRTLGTSRGPAEYRLRGHIGWRNDNSAIDLFVNHTPSHINDFNVELVTAAQPPLRRVINVPSYTTFDLTAHHEFDSLGLRISAGARNLFDADFPLSPLGGSTSFDASRVDPRGRVAFIELRKTF